MEGIYKFDIELQKLDDSNKLHCKFLNAVPEAYKKIQQDKVPKIYMLEFNNEIQYVGTTIQKQTTRLWQGLNGKYSYKWKELIGKKLFLTVVCFKDETIKFNELGSEYIKNFRTKIIENGKIIDGKIDLEIQKETKKQFIENIEAELVFLNKCNNPNGKWSDYQHEIHFNNFFDNGQDEAHKILEKLKNL